MNSSISNFKKTAKQIVADLLPFVFFLFLFDRLLFMAINKGESLFYSGAQFPSLQEKFSPINNKDKYRILILGSSRTYDGIHPWYICKEFGVRAFKEAFVGKGPKYNYFFYQEYKKFMGVPRVVIYGLDFFLFNIVSERHWLKRFSAELVDVRYFKRGISLLLTNKPQIDKFSNTFFNSLKKNPWGEPNFLIERDAAQMEAYRGVVSPGIIDAVEPPRFRKVRFFSYPGQEGEYFIRLLDELRRDQVTVLMVSLPEYIGTYWTNRNHRKFLRTFRRIDRAYDNVHFFDYNDPDIFDLANTEYFIDGGYGKTNSHLSRAGSEIFNRLLLRDLRRFIGEK